MKSSALWTPAGRSSVGHLASEVLVDLGDELFAYRGELHGAYVAHAASVAV
jgi:hypothetical protein